MRKNIDKNKFYLGIFTFLVVFWTVASIFGFIGYGRSTKYHKASNVITANADSITSNNINNFSIDFADVQGITLLDKTVDAVPTYLFLQDIAIPPGGFSYAGDFDCYAEIYSNMWGYNNGGIPTLYYDSTLVWVAGEGWQDEVYREVTFYEQPSGSTIFHQFLDEYAVLMSADRVEGSAMLCGKQTFTYDGITLKYNNHTLLTDSGGFVVPLEYYTKFMFSDYKSYNVPTQIIGDSYFNMNNYAYNILKQIDCEIFTDGVSLYLYYLLYFDSYVYSNTSLPISHNIAFTVYYDFADYANRVQGNSIYAFLPAINNTFLLTDELYLEYFYTLQESALIDYRQAYNSGYTAGVAVGGGGEYTFQSLLSAVIDVPVQTFISLFDMEILGIDLASFFLALLSVCACIAVIRYIL